MIADLGIEISTAEQQEQHRHAHGDAVGDLVGDHRVRRASATSAAISTPRFIGPGCMTSASGSSSAARAGGEAVARRCTRAATAAAPRSCARAACAAGRRRRPRAAPRRGRG